MTQIILIVGAALLLAAAGMLVYAILQNGITWRRCSGCGDWISSNGERAPFPPPGEVREWSGCICPACLSRYQRT
jgi:hypothetical protein